MAVIDGVEAAGSFFEGSSRDFGRLVREEAALQTDPARTPEQPADSQTPFRAFSEVFWQDNQDLFNADYGLVASYRIDEQGRVLSPDESAHYKTVSINFDARQRRSGKFAWQISLASATSGRDIIELTSAEEGHVFHVDAQGIFRSRRDLLPEAASETWRTLLRISRLPTFAGAIQEHRQKNQYHQKSLAAFILNKEAVAAPKAFAKELKDRTGAAKKVGFADIPLYKKPERIYEARLFD